MRSSTYLDGGIKYSKHNLKILQIHYRADWKCLNLIARSVLRFLEKCLCAFTLEVILTWSQVLLLLAWFGHESSVTGMQNLWLYSKTIIIFPVILCRNTLHRFSSFTWEGLNYVMNKRKQFTCNPFPSNRVTFSRLFTCPFPGKKWCLKIQKSPKFWILGISFLATYPGKRQ